MSSAAPAPLTALRLFVLPCEASGSDVTIHRLQVPSLPSTKCLVELDAWLDMMRRAISDCCGLEGDFHVEFALKVAVRQKDGWEVQ